MTLLSTLSTLPPADQRLTRHEAAGVLGVSPRSLRTYELKGYKGVRLIPCRIGGKLWYTRDLLETWVLETERARQAQNEAAVTGGEREHQAALKQLRQLGCDV